MCIKDSRRIAANSLTSGVRANPFRNPLYLKCAVSWVNAQWPIQASRNHRRRFSPSNRRLWRIWNLQQKSTKLTWNVCEQWRDCLNSWNFLKPGLLHFEESFSPGYLSQNIGILWGICSFVGCRIIDLGKFFFLFFFFDNDQKQVVRKTNLTKLTDNNYILKGIMYW